MELGDRIRRQSRNAFTRGRATVVRASDRARQHRGESRLHLAHRSQAAVVATAAKIATGGRRRWVRAVDDELINLDGCDYVAVEKEHGETFAVIARMHGPAANWVLARYASREDATRAQDWLANYLGARRVNIGADAEATNGADRATD
jgi:hypothetical protein